MGIKSVHLSHNTLVESCKFNPIQQARSKIDAGSPERNRLICERYFKGTTQRKKQRQDDDDYNTTLKRVTSVENGCNDRYNISPKSVKTSPKKLRDNPYPVQPPEIITT